MAKKTYIPGSDEKFLVWAKKLIECAFANATVWKVSPPNASINVLVEGFEAKLQKAKDPNRGKVDVLEKNEARKVLEKECRTYVQGFLARNPYVTNPDRETMGLTIYDVTPTVVPPPSVPVEGDLHFPAAGLVEVKNIRAVTLQVDKKAEYGVRIYYGILGTPDDTDKFRINKPPKTGDDLPHSVFTRQKRYRFDFTGESGRQVFLCMRFENSKGQAGPWGKIIQAYIP
jgi:hypothetical protein